MAMPMPQPQSQPAEGGQPAGNEQVKAQLIQLLKQAAMLAQKNGIDFKALVMEVMGGGASPAPSSPAPRPPMP